MAQRAGRTVVAGVDGSDSALAAVRWAAREARSLRLPLRLVNACPWPEHHFGQVPLGLDYRKAFVRVAREHLLTAAEEAVETAPGVEVARQVIISYPLPALIAESKRAQMVVVGNRGLGGITGLLVGSVAVGLAARGACPVVVVRGEPPVAPDPPRPVVVGVDGSERSEAALAFGFEAASARAVPLVAVLAWDYRRVGPIFGERPTWEAIEDSQRRVLAERLAGWGDKYPEVTVRRVVSKGHPAHCLLAHAGRAQLVVVGSHGRGGLSGLLLGSVSQSLLRHAPCPVAVVRPDDQHVTPPN